MLRPITTSRHLLRHAITARSSSLQSQYASIPRRFASSSTGPKKGSSWKSFFARLGLAGGAIYYYNTSPIFGNEVSLPPLGSEPASEQPLTLDTIKKPVKPTSTNSSAPAPAPATTNPEALEAEAGQQGAFNEETGEINWDCPCLGGMAHGPCGPQFREAFSCFVFSQEDPKGMDCVDKFKGMQECFRAHPDVYGAELEDDEDYVPPAEGGEESNKQTQSHLRPSEDVEYIEDKIGEAAGAVKQKATQARDVAKNKASEAGQFVQDKASEAKEKLGEVRQSVKAKASEAGQYAQEKTAEARQYAKEKGAEASQYAQEKSSEASRYASQKKEEVSQQARQASESTKQAAADLESTTSEKTSNAKKSLYDTVDSISGKVDDHLEKVKDPKTSA